MTPNVDPASRAMVLALNNLDYDTRVLNEAQTLAEMGFHATCVGIVTSPDDAREESRPFGRIVRVLTSQAALLPRQPHAPTRVSTKVPSPVATLRHFLGRIRENVVIARSVDTTELRVVIACDLNALLAGLLIRRRSGAAVIYDVHDLWTERSTIHGRFAKGLWSFYEKKLIRRADAVMTVNEGIAAVLVERYGVPLPLSVMNGPRVCLAARPQLPGDPLRAVCLGLFSTDRGFDQAVEAVAALGGRVHLTLQGWGPLEPELREQVERLGASEWVTFVPPCAPEETSAAASAHDVGIVAIAPTCLNSALGSPNKLFAYIGGGLALVTPDIPVPRSIVERFDCGVVFEKMRAPDVAEALSTLADDSSLVARMKEGSRRACEELSWPRQAEALERLVRELMADPASADSAR